MGEFEFINLVCYFVVDFYVGWRYFEVFDLYVCGFFYFFVVGRDGDG